MNRKEMTIDSEKVSKTIKILLLIFSLSFFSLIILSSSPLAPWINVETGADSAVFRTIAYEMRSGLVPYRDTFDHKGPLLYFINYIGQSLSFHSGLWYIEFVSLFSTLFILFKIARLKANWILSILAVLLSATTLFLFFDGGNLVEEFAMPFISISILIFLEYLLKGRINRIRLIVCGFSFGAVLLLRPNMAAIWVTFSLGILLKEVKDKSYKKLLNFLFYFLIGAVIIVVPFVLYFTYKGAFSDFIYSYLKFNMLYTFAMKEKIGKYMRLKSFLFFLSNPMITLSLIVLMVELLLKKFKVNLLYLISILFSLIMIAISGRTFEHYGMVLVPLITYPIASFLNVQDFIKDEDKNKNFVKYFTLILAIFLLQTYIANTWIKRADYVAKSISNRNEDLYQPITTKIKNIVLENSNKNDKITVYGNMNEIYLITDRHPASKYSYQLPINKVDQNIEKEYIEDLKKNNPKLIVTEMKPSVLLEEFIRENNYKLIMKETVDNREYTVFKRN